MRNWLVLAAVGGLACLSLCSIARSDVIESKRVVTRRAYVRTVAPLIRVPVIAVEPAVVVKKEIRVVRPRREITALHPAPTSPVVWPRYYTPYVPPVKKTVDVKRTRRGIFGVYSRTARYSSE